MAVEHEWQDLGPKNLWAWCPRCGALRLADGEALMPVGFRACHQGADVLKSMSEVLRVMDEDPSVGPQIRVMHESGATVVPTILLRRAREAVDGE